jgi:hypothetical protein
MRKLATMLAAMLVVALSAPAGKLDEAAARSLLERWLKAQNAQDFAGYQALYGKKFDGIKRAGARSRSFDRKSWMADRQKMLARAMSVAAEKVTVEVLPGMARVRFVQSFTLGRFHDEGPKELLLVQEGGRLVISREEMLSSTMGAAPAKAGGDLFVVPGGVLLPVTADDGWGRGAPRLLPQGDSAVYAATRAVDPAALPAEARAWQGRTVNLVGGCTARIRGLALLVRADPHFSTTQYWDGLVDRSGEPIEHGKPLSSAAIAGQLWKLAPVELIGVFDQKCPEARWGSAGPRPPLPATLIEVDPAEALGRAALAIARKHPAYRRLQKEFDDNVKETGGPGGAWAAEVKLRRADAAGQSLLVLTASRYEGCADFGGGLTFVFRRGAGDKLTLLNDPGAEEPWALEEAADLDGDGTLDLATANATTNDVSILLGTPP